MTRHAARTLIRALGPALVLVVMAAAPALAVTAPIHISGTGSDGVVIRPTPDTSQPAIGWMPEGASPDFSCFTYGQQVGNVNVWFEVSYNGVNGFYASYWDDSRYSNEAELTSRYGVPRCGAGTGSSASSSTTSTQPAASAAGPAVSYNRAAAASWATQHARDTPPADSACTWFVSQALWAGGLPTSASWTSAGHHGLRRRSGSQTAWYTPDFVQYIRSTFPRSTYTALNFKNNSVPAARPGDVIVYSWNGGASVSNTHGLDHAALVVDIATNQYPEVSEWSISDLGPLGRPSSYTKRGWTWSAKSHTWLQSKYAAVQAFLLHIDTGS